MTNQLTWTEFCAMVSDRQRKRERAFRTWNARCTKLAAIADSRTGGHYGLCLNWGNAESVRIWRDDSRWRSYANECDRRYRAAWNTFRTDKAA